MSDKLLIEVDMSNGEAGDAVRALVFLAHELSESRTITISDPVEWRERATDDYQLRWRYCEDALSSWQVTISADMAVLITDALRVAQSALREKVKRRNDSLNEALSAIEKAHSAITTTIVKTEPGLCHFLPELCL